MNIKSWEESGQYVTINVHRIFFIDSGGDKPVLAILHGYPTCSFDYWKVLPALSANYRVIIHDHLGFGLSDKPSNNSYLLVDQAALALQLWQFLGINQLHLFAHDYGTSIATELIAKQNQGSLPLKISKTSLCNGSMLIHMSKLRPIQKMLNHKYLGPIVASLSNEKTFQRNMKKLWANPALCDIVEMSNLWKLMMHKKGKKVLPKITRYIDQRYENYDRWIGALKESKIPFHIIWADKDPVAVIQMADELERIIPNNKKTILKNLGHYPMIEDPIRWVNALLDT